MKKEKFTKHEIISMIIGKTYPTIQPKIDFLDRKIGLDYKKIYIGLNSEQKKFLLKKKYHNPHKEREEEKFEKGKKLKRIFD